MGCILVPVPYPGAALREGEHRSSVEKKLPHGEVLCLVALLKGICMPPRCLS